jgi:hypothetical protein
MKNNYFTVYCSIDTKLLKRIRQVRNEQFNRQSCQNQYNNNNDVMKSHLGSFLFGLYIPAQVVHNPQTSDPKWAVPRSSDVNAVDYTDFDIASSQII